MYPQQGNRFDKSPLTKAIGKLAMIASIVVTFFATPLVYEQSIEGVKDYTADHYGYGMVDVVPFFWGCCTVLVTFFISTVVLIVAIQLVNFWLIRR